MGGPVETLTVTAVPTLTGDPAAGEVPITLPLGTAVDAAVAWVAPSPTLASAAFQL